jgi:hypothetical protein
MKIHELPIGTQFEFQGQPYVKTGPQVAEGPAGRRLIPRHATLRPLAGPAAEPASSADETLSRADVEHAFGAFYARCCELVPADRQVDLEWARDQFRKALAVH